MHIMFRGSTSFNQPLSTWNTSSVTTMREMFRDASSFNHDISDWNVSSVINMGAMLQGANILSDNNKEKFTNPSPATQTGHTTGGNMS